MLTLKLLCALIVSFVLLSACASSSAPTSIPAALPATPDEGGIETRVAANIFGTQTASAPTTTSTPSQTATTTNTNTPLPTDTPRPTDTLTLTLTPTKTETPRPTLVPRPKSTATAATVPFDQRPRIPFGQDVTIGNWTFHALAVYKDKNVWFYDETKVANGEWAAVEIKAQNIGPGTDWMANTLLIGIVDQSKNIYIQDLLRGEAEYYARWEFCGCEGAYSDVNPGESPGVILLFDVPENTENLELAVVAKDDKTKTAILDLGTPFSQLPIGKPKK